MTDRVDSGGLYSQYCSLDADKSKIGLIPRENGGSSYYCTPNSAEIIGWLGVDGIHFCFIPTMQPELSPQDGKVYAVSPIPCFEHPVVPIANTFYDFLSLIIACFDSSILESISYTSKEQFEESLRSARQEASLETSNVLREIQNKLNIQPHAYPYEYVKSIQDDFEYKSIPFTDAYYEVTGEERG